MIKTCRCGKQFDTNKNIKVYCSSNCQKRFNATDNWDKVKGNYKTRCRQLGQMAKHRAKVQNLKFNLNKEYLIKLWEEQNGRCSLSGRQFDLSRPSENETVKANAPSVDRIIPIKGYTKGNVRFVCYQVNTALNEYGEEALIQLCNDIIKFRKSVA